MAKYLLYISLFAALAASLSAQDAPLAAAPVTEGAVEASSAPDEKKEADIPPARRPKKGDSQKCADRKAEDKSDEDDEKRRDTFKYGITTEVVQLLAELTANDDPRYVDEAYDMFQTSHSVDVQEKTLIYFGKFSDPCLADFTCETLNNYYDSKTILVNAALRYAGEVKCREAVPAIKTVINDGDERFWQAAMTAMGSMGEGSEAVFLTELFDREAEEMTVAKKQSLVRALGMIHATDTWDALVGMAENEDENKFVRMYAAEAIGSMEKSESVPVLTGLYSSSDPNLREYVIKGLAHYKGDGDAASTITEAIKDAHPRVRIEAIKDAAELGISNAVPLIVFRAKTDDEGSVKKAAFDALAKLGAQDGVKFLTGLLSDKKASDGAKKHAAESLLKAGDAGDKAIADAALDALADNRKKPLRKTLGSVIAHYDKAAFAPVCRAYLESGESDTVSLGLDMYQRGKYGTAADAVRTIAETKGSNKKRAMKMLGMEEED